MSRESDPKVRGPPLPPGGGRHGCASGALSALLSRASGIRTHLGPQPGSRRQGRLPCPPGSWRASAGCGISPPSAPAARGSLRAGAGEGERGTAVRPGVGLRAPVTATVTVALGNAFLGDGLRGGGWLLEVSEEVSPRALRRVRTVSQMEGGRRGLNSGPEGIQAPPRPRPSPLLQTWPRPCPGPAPSARSLSRSFEGFRFQRVLGPGVLSRGQGGRGVRGPGDLGEAGPFEAPLFLAPAPWGTVWPRPGWQ